jgi:hypothetical protein
MSRDCKITIVFVFCLAFSQVAFAQKIKVEGSLFERPFFTTVNHSLAATMLFNRQDSSVVNLFAQHRDAALNNAMLENITKKYSIDVATLFLAEKIYESPANKRAQDDYWANLSNLSAADLVQSFDFLKDYHIAFIPGFNYEANKSNFEEQRRLLDAAGISNEMIITQPFGLIDNNAEIVANRLREVTRQHSNIILVSISRGGAETGIALSRLLLPEEMMPVKAWINACGILRGTPVADYWAKPFRKMWLGLGMFFSGKGSINLKSMTSDLSYSRRKNDVLTIPKNIYTVNFVAVSLGQNPNRIAMQVPNDGYSPLLDEITDNGAVVIEIGNGLNHTLEKLDINPCLAAILRHIVKHNSRAQ